MDDRSLVKMKWNPPLIGGYLSVRSHASTWTGRWWPNCR